MRPQTRRFSFREDAIAWIRRNGFQYVDFFGWVHPAHGLCAIVELRGTQRRPWVLTTYKSAIPTVSNKELSK